MEITMQIELGDYIWKSENTDFPVKVIESLGKGSDGRFYVKIAESTTAVPFDELKKVQVSTSRKPISKKLFGL